jgi:hypothetical protein
MEVELVKDSIKRLYNKLDMKTLECYSLHLKLAKEHPILFQEFHSRAKVAEECEADRKRKLLDKKLNKLRNRSPRATTMMPTVHHIEGLVVNKSSLTKD